MKCWSLAPGLRPRHVWRYRHRLLVLRIVGRIGESGRIVAPPPLTGLLTYRRASRHEAVFNLLSWNRRVGQVSPEE